MWFKKSWLCRPHLLAGKLRHGRGTRFPHLVWTQFLLQTKENGPHCWLWEVLILTHALFEVVGSMGSGSGSYFYHLTPLFLSFLPSKGIRVYSPSPGAEDTRLSKSSPEASLIWVAHKTKLWWNCKPLKWDRQIFHFTWFSSCHHYIEKLGVAGGAGRNNKFYVYFITIKNKM